MRLPAEFKRKLVTVLILGALAGLLLRFISDRYSIGISAQDCLDYRVFVVVKGRLPEKGGYVCFRATNIEYYSRRAKLVKMVECLPGERVSVERVREKTPVRVPVDGVEREFIPASSVRTCTGRVLTAFERGSSGRPLPQLPEGEIRLRGYFVTGTHPAAYDSRYFGEIRAEDIIGVAYPVF